MLNIRENSFICTCNLYEIAQNLSESIKLDRDEPFCLNQRTLQRNEIYNLQKDICLEPVSFFFFSFIIFLNSGGGIAIKKSGVN